MYRILRFEKWVVIIIAFLLFSVSDAASQPLDYGAEDLEELQGLCERGDAVGCAGLGVLYFKGAGVTQNYEKATALFRQACKDGAARGCTDLGSMYVRGVRPEEAIGFSLEKDYARARILYGKGCDEGDAIGCINSRSLRKTDQ